MKRILMATDLSARSDRALERALQIASKRGSELVVVHAVDEELPRLLISTLKDYANQSLNEHLKKLGVGEAPSVSIEVVTDRPHVAVLEMAEKTAAELIVLGVHREDAFKDFFIGTTAERIIRSGAVPILLVKDQVYGPYQRIMVGVDFSVYSRRAIEFTAKLEPDGEFHLVHAYEIPFKGFLNDPMTRKKIKEQHDIELKKMIEVEMAGFLSNMSAKAPKLERIIELGSAREVIHHQVSRIKPELLVIGTHGRTGVARGFLGSIAEDLLRNPPCDVLAVKAW